MNTDRGSVTIEGLVIIAFLMLVCAMAVETRCLIGGCQNAGTGARNRAVAAASSDTDDLRLGWFEESHRPRRACICAYPRRR